MSGVYVIGIGSPCGADRYGWDAIEALRQAGFAERCQPLQVVLACCASPAQLPGLLADADAVVVVDALQAHGTEAVQRLQWSEIAERSAATSSHGIGLSEALQLADRLYGLSGKSAVLGITVVDSGAAEVSEQMLTRLETELLSVIYAA